jgi:hypothetical protein
MEKLYSLPALSFKVWLHSIRILVLFFLPVTGISQNVSNEGKEFWVGFMQNNSTPAITLRISSRYATTGTVSAPLAGWSAPFTVAAGSVTTVSVPVTLVGAGSGIQNKGIRIISNDTITVFASSYAAATFDATAVLPKPALGKEYRTLNYFPVGASGAEFMIVATENNTTIKVTPKVTPGVAPAPFTITLNAGQVYQYQAADLTGTYIEGLNCKNFAVFSGSVCSFIPASCYACDHLYEQVYPISTWGKSFIATPFVRTATNSLRVVASEDSTTVNIGGATALLLTAGSFYETTFPAGIKIFSDKPIQVGQYAQSLSCSGVGDPFLINIAPLEQKRKNLIYSSIATPSIDSHYVNVIIRTAYKGTVMLNGVSKAGALWLPIASDTAYSYSQLRCNAGSNTLTAADGFTAYVYGFGNSSFESYGYSAGSNLNILNDIMPVCKGDSLELTSPPGISYSWSNGKTTRSVTVYPVAGTIYSVTVTNNCTPFVYSFTVSAGCNITVPLRLLGFRTEKVADKVMLSWTLSEPKAENSLFRIERSYDGRHFSIIGLEAAENGKLSYAFTDSTLSPVRYGQVYYRIRMINSMGATVISKTLTLENGMPTKRLKAGPNPLRQGSALRVEILSESGKAYICVYNKLGVKVLEKHTGDEETTHLELPTEELLPDFYLLEVTQDQHKEVFPFLVH